MRRNLVEILLSIPAVFLAIAFHEFAMHTAHTGLRSDS